jgi:hypothetical protein
MNIHRRQLLAGALLGAALPARAADDGRRIAEAFANRPQGKDLTAVSRMDLTEPGRTTRTRRLVSYRLVKGPAASTYLLRFLAPGDISGVGLLNQPKPDGGTDQWLYLPELDRARRIASNRKGGRFVGSDLYFEDLQERKPGDDQHTLLRQEAIGPATCDVVESIPTDATESVYRKRVSWIDRESLLALRIDYHESDDAAPNKRWTVSAHRRVQGFWTVMDSTMTDLKRGSSTRLVVEAALYDRKLPGRLFTPQALADEGLESEYRP